MGKKSPFSFIMKSFFSELKQLQDACYKNGKPHMSNYAHKRRYMYKKYYGYYGTYICI